ncbi:hypothetical protein ACFLTS_02840 [Chloroflexota bacterium]
MGFVRQQISYLFSGVIFWLPIGVVVIAGRYIVGNLEGLGKDFLGFFLAEESIYTGLGIVLWLIVFIITGLVLKKTRVGDLLAMTPFVGIFFRKSGESITLDKLIKLTPCLFLFSPTCLSYGWVLSEQDVKLNEEKANFNLVNVYYPNVPTLITGQVYSARKETVIKLENKSREIIDILLYGLRRPEYIRYIPWEDEKEDEFQQRAKQFGLVLSAQSNTNAAIDRRNAAKEKR